MKQFIPILILMLAVSGCALTSAPIQPAPIQPAPQVRAQAVVFDIDGTLTPDVMSIFKVRPEAAEAAQLYADKGFTIIYLSARIKIFQSNIPGWLKKYNFPDGPIHVPETRADGENHAAFKTRILEKYLSEGWTLAYAYGDSSSDFEAYTAVGIPKEHIFALQRKGDDACQPGIWNACLKNWNEQIDFIENLSPSMQLGK